MIVGAYFGQWLAPVWAKTLLRVSQGKAVYHLGGGGDAKELMHALLYLGMQLIFTESALQVEAIPGGHLQRLKQLFHQTT